MDFEEDILLIMNVMRQNLMRVLESGRQRTVRRIMNARQTLVQSQRTSSDFLANYVLLAAGEAVLEVSMCRNTHTGTLKNTGS